MTPERWRQIDQLLEAAMDREPAKRAAFINQACAGDEDLRREVASLLDSHDHAASFIETPPEDVVAGMVAEQQSRSMLGRTLGHYQLHTLLGAGGMGEVYRARDTRLDRDVAVKILPEHLAQDSKALRRFEREAKAVAGLSHPNILAIHDFGNEQGVSYAVMELLEGETLRARLTRSALPWREAVQTGIAITEGLAAAHAKGIIHRDLKPENIFLTSDGGVKILDFGIARMKHVVAPDAEPLTRLTTRQGTIMGTIDYMSPEQLRGEEVDAPSDIFSFGSVLYEMLSGKRLFARATAAEAIAAILNEGPLPLTQAEEKIAAEMERLISHCLEKRSEDRYQSARDLALDLRAILSSGCIVSSSPLRVRRQKSLTMWLGAATAGLVLAIALLLYPTVWREQAIDSLAVLPLVNASGDGDVDYLSDGITESLINSLAQLPQLRVMAQSTMFSYKQKQVDPRQVGQELRVSAVLSGKVLQRGDTLTVTTELVKAADGSQLWNGQFSHRLADLTLLQPEIAKQISETLRLTLTGAEQRRLAKRHTENAEAYQLYLKGRAQSNMLSIEGVKKGIEYLNQAVALDPSYALAYAGLADAYLDASSVSIPADEALPRAKLAAEQALSLDETLAEAHAALAHIKGNYEWNWAEAEQQFKRTIELRPSYARVHQGYGLFLMEQGRMDEAIAAVARARELEPLTNSLSALLAFFHYLARRYDEAIIQSQKLIRLDPTLAVAHYNLGMAYEQKGNYEEAIAAFNQAQLLDPQNPVVSAFLCHAYALMGKRGLLQKPLAELMQQAKQGNLDPVHIGLIYAALGDKDQAFVWLEKAYQTRSEDLLNLKVNPKFDSLRSDPRLTDLLRRLKLAP